MTTRYVFLALGGCAVIAACPSTALGGVCSVLVPKDAQLAPSGATQQCEPGSACEIEDCSGWLEVEHGVVRVVYKSRNNRSEIVEVRPGEGLSLQDLQADDTLSAAVRNVVRILWGNPRQPIPRGGRSAIQPGTAGEIPSGQIAVLGERLSFTIPGASPGAAYSFHPIGDSSAVTRIPLDDGVAHIDAGLLPAGERFRGGVEGGPLVPFQVAAESKSGRVSEELEAFSALTPAGAAYGRALVYFDNGLSWNARRELAALGTDAYGGGVQ